MTNANEITLEKEENKMGVMPIPKLLITMSLPMMISMLIQALYNIVDSMFVAQLSDCLLYTSLISFDFSGIGYSAFKSAGSGSSAFTFIPILYYLVACLKQYFYLSNICYIYFPLIVS